MHKVTKLIILLAAGVVMFALSTSASAQETHITGITSFTGSGGSSSLAASGEPTLTCESMHVQNGTIETGGTTGSMYFDFTGCHKNVFGFTVKCRTAGSPLDNTVTMSGTFHMITFGSNKPALLMTPVSTVVECAGIAKTTISGSVIGTITSPACGGESKGFSVSFSATGSTQNHILYTGSSHDLVSQTGGGSPNTAGLNLGLTLSSISWGTLVCT